MSVLPQPVNLKLTSNHFIHMLNWEPGPGTPPGVSYQVSYTTDTWVSSWYRQGSDVWENSWLTLYHRKIQGKQNNDTRHMVLCQTVFHWTRSPTH